MFSKLLMLLGLKKKRTIMDAPVWIRCGGVARAIKPHERNGRFLHMSDFLNK